MTGDTLDDSEGHDELEPQEPLRMTVSHKRKLVWAREIIQDAERYGTLEGSSRQSKKPKLFSSYVALMCDLVDHEPSRFEEVVRKKEWVEAMIEEYQSIMKNDVVPRPKGKDVVSKSNMQMTTDLWPMVSLRKRELIMKKRLLL